MSQESWHALRCVPGRTSAVLALVGPWQYQVGGWGSTRYSTLPVPTHWLYRSVLAMPPNASPSQGLAGPGGGWGMRTGLACRTRLRTRLRTQIQDQIQDQIQEYPPQDQYGRDSG